MLESTSKRGCQLRHELTVVSLHGLALPVVEGENRFLLQQLQFRLELSDLVDPLLGLWL